ncbi:glycosyltransferase family 2 protein [Shivajiella indica]|uniref:Glycosyltransferase family 2 protein n=1 Tax=Shivajiella indica TaxID=872115 RepID=A0ABW5BE80_9BACT
MTVSIIIPTYNRGELLRETIDSIIGQSYPFWELLIIDDESSDNTHEIVEKYEKQDSRIKYFKRPNNLPKGANACRNYGLSLASGTFIKWVDSDDLLKENNLELQIKVLKENRNIKVCLGYSQNFFKNKDNLKDLWSRSFESNNFFYDHIKNNIRWHLGAILWKKEALNQEPFSNSLMNSQEWLMNSIALLDLEHSQIYNLKEIIYLVRRGHRRISSNTSSSYYFHQTKARFLLLLEMLKRGRFDFLCVFELTKQILANSYYTIKGLAKDQFNFKYF